MTFRAAVGRRSEDGSTASPSAYGQTTIALKGITQITINASLRGCHVMLHFDAIWMHIHGARML